MKLKVSMFFLVLGMLACHPTKKIDLETTEVKAKNVILMIGDGMGLAQITGAMIRNGYNLNLEQFSTIGLHKSYAADDLITDSAAGATAFASGVKTYNAAIGVTVDTQAVGTILEEAHEKGFKTGLVATSTIVHATPASFFSHNRHRNNYEEIAADLLNNNVDFFVGGGKKYFDRRKDERNLVKELEDKGYTIKNFIESDIATVDIPKGKFGFLSADGDPLPASQGRDYLLPATKRALEYLGGKEAPFFLMVEGSQIDWGGHSNEAEYIVSELLDFDRTIGYVLEWMKKDNNTLLVITADHETGGFAINPGTTRDSIVAGFTTTHHTGSLIPVFAKGPGERIFGGIYENNTIYDKMRSCLGWGPRP